MLINCPECGKQVSDKASNCPECGCPINATEKKEQPATDGVHYARPNGNLPKQEKPKKKKKGLWIVIGILVLFAGCGACMGGSEESAQEEVQNEVVEYVPEDEIENVFSNPSDYYGKYIKLSGEIFTNPELGENEISFQMFCDVKNSEDNAYVTYESENAKEVNNYEYVIVDGKIKGSVSGKNIVGGVVTALEIEAVSVEESNYIDVVVPTIKELAVNQKIDQLGYVVTVDKIEFAEKETRVYVTVQNNGSDNFSVYSWSTKIVQDGKQFEPEFNFYYDYEEVQSDLIVGTSTSGVINFAPLDITKSIQIHIDGSSNNWDEEIETYIFDIENK